MGHVATWMTCVDDFASCMLQTFLSRRRAQLCFVCLFPAFHACASHLLAHVSRLFFLCSIVLLSVISLHDAFFFYLMVRFLFCCFVSCVLLIFSSLSVLLPCTTYLALRVFFVCFDSDVLRLFAVCLVVCFDTKIPSSWGHGDDLRG